MIRLNLKKIKKNQGFALLIAVTLAAIFLSIALGAADVALKEINFSTSAKDTNNAFFAADTGAECALFNDKSTSNSFVASGGSGSVQCLGSSIPLTTNAYPVFKFILTGLGGGGQSCSIVTVNKNGSGTCGLTTCIVSEGYNNGTGACVPVANAVNRELDTNYN